MTKNNLLQKLAPVGVAAILGAIAATTAPAQAYSGSMAWVGLTDDFVNELNPDLSVPPLDSPPDTFDVMFGLDGAANDTTITSTSGDFVQWLGAAPPPFLVNLPKVTAEFEQTIPLPGTPPALAVYKLVNDEVFDFSGALLPGAGITSLQWVAPAGTQYLLTDLTANNADLNLCNTTCETNPYWVVDGQRLNAVSGQNFKDDPASGGTYGKSSEIKVPEPSSVLGLLAVGGLGLGMLRKKQG